MIKVLGTYGHEIFPLLLVDLLDDVAVVARLEERRSLAAVVVAPVLAVH